MKYLLCEIPDRSRNLFFRDRRKGPPIPPPASCNRETGKPLPITSLPRQSFISIVQINIIKGEKDLLREIVLFCANSKIPITNYIDMGKSSAEYFGTLGQ